MVRHILRDLWKRMSRDSRDLALVAVVALSLSTVACAADAENEADAAQSADQDLVEQRAKFQVFQGEDADYYFRFVAANGEILLRSEGYITRQSADKGIEVVPESAPDARNIEQLEAVDGSFYYTVKSANGEIIAVSETYVSKSNALRGARAVSALTRILRSEY